MKKPQLKEFKKFDKLSQYPDGTYYEAGHLVVKNSSWRNEKPVVDDDKCKNCLLCYMYCPDGVISKGNGTVKVDYDYCKGCGICVKVCKFNALRMEDE